MHLFRTMSLTFIASVICAAEVIVVSSSNPATSISAADLGAMFEGKKGNWDDGTKVVLVINPDSPSHEAFLRTHVSKTPQQFATAWKKIVFTGKGAAPTSVKSDAELIEAVAKQSGAIAYMSDEGVKGLPAGAAIKVLPIQ